MVYAGRMIPEKQAPAVVAAVMHARERVPELTARIFGDGPQLLQVREEIDCVCGAEAAIAAPGFVGGEVEDARWRAPAASSCPRSARATARSSSRRQRPACRPCSWRAPDNAAVEHIVEGVNGYVAADASPEALGAAIAECWERRADLRASTFGWFSENAEDPERRQLGRARRRGLRQRT